MWNLQADRTKKCNSDNGSLFSVGQGWLRNSWAFILCKLDCLSHLLRSQRNRNLIWYYFFLLHNKFYGAKFVLCFSCYSINWKQNNIIHFYSFLWLFLPIVVCLDQLLRLWIICVTAYCTKWGQWLSNLS